MATIFSRMRPGAASSAPSSSSNISKKDPNTPQLTPLEKHLLDSGPPKEDGSDKFWGLENFGNTCYANSILQCLYYSAPFRQQVISYPNPTPSHSVLHGPTGQQRLHINTTSLPLGHPSLTYAKLMNRPTTQNASARTSGPPTAPKPEDKEHPDYKKRVAQTRGPNMTMNYDNAAAYGMDESLFTSLKDIFEALAVHQSRVGVVSPARLLEILRRDNEMYRTAMHQDAHEFLNLLLNDIMDVVKAHSKKSEDTQHTNGSVEKSEFEKELEKAMPQLKGRERWIHDLFEGTLTSETKCLTCENASQRDEVFLDLSVDLEEHTSVTSCLRKFSEEEMLCERNKFHCDICGGLQEAEKRMKIKRLPKILALHLKRFKFTDDFQRLQKLFHRVVYPYHLRLFNTTDDVDDPDRLYELYAVVVHIGGGPYHGHYVSIIKTEDRGWLLFDDEMVEPVDKSYVQNFFGDRPGLACAYVLFYQETTMEAVRREQENEIRPSAVKPVIPIKENVSLGTKANGFLGGLYHVKSAATPANMEEVKDSLEKVMSDPSPANGTLIGHNPATGEDLTALPALPVSANTLDDSKSKKDRQREEKERRAAARFQAKEEEKERRRTLELMRRDKTRKSEADPRITVSRPEEEPKIGHDNTPDLTNGSSGGLSRFRNSSKSFRKPKFLSSREASKDEPPVNGTGNSAAPIATPKSDNVTKGVEKSPDKARNRFSTALRKKTSTMMM